MSEQPFCNKCKKYDFNCTCTNYEKMAKGMFNHHLNKDAKYLGYELVSEKNPKSWLVHKNLKSIIVKYELGGTLMSSKFRVKREFQKYAR